MTESGFNEQEHQYTTLRLHDVERRMDEMMSGSFTAQATIEVQENEIASLKRAVEEVKEESEGAFKKIET